jgi:hypothetical protein
MVINMDESQLRTIEQIEQFLAASAEVTFTAHGDDLERYAHISRVLKRLVKQWHSNRLASVPLIKRYKAPVMPFARRYTTPDIELLVERWIKPMRMSVLRPSRTS